MEKKEQFRNDAKLMVDSLFENRLLREGLTRDDMMALEDWICITLDWRLESTIKCKEIIERFEKRKTT